uniref:FK506-binding protein n=1 Tax=Eptatretus burgeri TaxID=7764 RepID=A0A8C4NFU4_EPTBU
MFWGLRLEHGKQYSQEVSNDFHLTMAALDPVSAVENDSKESRLVSVVVRVKGADFMLCTLEHGKIWQHSLDLIFSQGEKVCFFIEGSGAVYVTGYYLGEDDLDDEGDKEVNDKDEGVEEEEEGEEKEVKTPISVVNGKRHACRTSNQCEPKRLKEMQEEKHKNGVVGKEAKAIGSQKPGKAENQVSFLRTSRLVLRKVDNWRNECFAQAAKLQVGSDLENALFSCDCLQLNSMKGKQNSQTPEVGRVKGKHQGLQEMPRLRLATQEDNSKAAGVQRVLRCGTVIEDLVVGKGPKAKKGKEVSVYYCGKLENGTVFDSLNVGKGFVFRLGVGEVIPGWDIGLSGMLVGGKRRLIIPPAQGYANKRVGPIPKNSTLIFEVELKNVE